MELREELDQRLEILEGGGLISTEVAKCCKKVIDLVLKEKSDADADRMGMFVTHLAMAMQRIRSGQDVNSIDEEILDAVKLDTVYPKAEEFSQRMVVVSGVEFPQAERDFLCVHLCNLFK